ncbi:hypothetical protein Pla175_13240 [Pirellulimonas nuda]|uniref:Uncharacterized protein n=1 Tax=Pirellulimonas nuda TaxID=2528009 RepID=A0A518D908_9BACT|nr:hypothetical protein [Pirellulimonas nuda]QDU87957.1 hypothetical protein Pla175_13240 [Pirellulimonas nuda]
MSHRQLLSAVSHATGESRRTIDRLGFSLATPMDVRHDPEPQIVVDEAYDFEEAKPLAADIAHESYLDWDDAWQARYGGALTAGV